jgi:hypothetical protein
MADKGRMALMKVTKVPGSWLATGADPRALDSTVAIPFLHFYNHTRREDSPIPGPQRPDRARKGDALFRRGGVVVRSEELCRNGLTDLVAQGEYRSDGAIHGFAGRQLWRGGTNLENSSRP